MSISSEGHVLSFVPHNVAGLANVIEIYNFSPSLDTRDLLQEFQDYSRAKLCIKWVDDTHALGVFASERQGELEDNLLS